MYDPTIVQNRLDRVTDHIRATTTPKFQFHDYSIAEVTGRVRVIESLVNKEKKVMLRPTTEEERNFINHELARCKVDFQYWASRYVRIKTKGQQLILLKFSEAQRILLGHIGESERAAVGGETGDGIILMCCKARQVGISTLSEAIIAHRTFFYANTTALIAGDVDSQSAYLFDMLERVYDNLPWWMRPERDYHVKDAQMYFGKQDSLIIVEAGRSTRGGQTMQRQRGQIGRGKTLPLAHLSELSTWDNPDQIDDSLMPAIPENARSFAMFESTARGRGNWWHNAWLSAKKGLGRRKPVFIPWYVEEQYSRPAPLIWTPSPMALAHARRVAERSPAWCKRQVNLTRDQLYWWEFTRADAAERKKLHLFLAEYVADDLEGFQNTSVSVFPNELIAAVREAASDPITVVDILPRTELRRDAARA